MAGKVQICAGRGEASLAGAGSQAANGEARRLKEPPRGDIHGYGELRRSTNMSRGGLWSSHLARPCLQGFSCGRAAHNRAAMGGL